MRPLDQTNVNDSVMVIKKLVDDSQTGSVLPSLFPKKTKIGFIDMIPFEEEKKEPLIVEEVD